MNYIDNDAMNAGPVLYDWVSLPKRIEILPRSAWSVGGKRFFDIISASAAIVFFAPVFALIALLLYVLHTGPVLFVQQRIGRNGQPFGCFKFRTMHVEAEQVLASHLASNPLLRLEWEQTQKLKEDPRVHRLGRILRISSLDELPQLFNVVLGHMSLVGPRPIVLGEVINYADLFAHYMAVRPGITGLWQVSGRNDTNYDERVALDCRYVRELSFPLDVRILLRTVQVVLSARGAY